MHLVHQGLCPQVGDPSARTRQVGWGGEPLRHHAVQLSGQGSRSSHWVGFQAGPAAFHLAASSEELWPPGLWWLALS